MPTFPYSEEVISAIESERKFRFYVLGLIFTLLALTIQSGQFGRSIIEDLLEVNSWIFLLIAGLAGLSRVEWESVVRLQMEREKQFQGSRTNLLHAKNQGLTTAVDPDTLQQTPIDDQIADTEKAIKILATEIEKLQGSTQFKYDVSKYCFLGGLILVIVSRSIGPVFALFGASLT